MTVKCICLDDRDKPKEVPLHLWVKQDQEYHITAVYWHPIQGVEGVELLEIAMDESCYPYTTYQLRRFGFTEEGLKELRELIKLCNELEEVDVEKLMKECTPDLIREPVADTLS